MLYFRIVGDQSKTFKRIETFFYETFSKVENGLFLKKERVFAGPGSLSSGLSIKHLLFIGQIQKKKRSEKRLHSLSSSFCLKLPTIQTIEMIFWQSEWRRG